MQCSTAQHQHNTENNVRANLLSVRSITADTVSNPARHHLRTQSKTKTKTKKKRNGTKEKKRKEKRQNGTEREKKNEKHNKNKTVQASEGERSVRADAAEMGETLPSNSAVRRTVMFLDAFGPKKKETLPGVGNRHENNLQFVAV